MSRIAKSDANAALDRIVQNVKGAAGADGVTTRDELKAALPAIASPTERALTDRFFQFAQYRDGGAGTVGAVSLDGSAAYAKEHLLAKYDVNHNGFSKAEIQKMSMTGQLVLKLAQELKGAAPIEVNTPTSALGRTITAAAKDCDYMSESDSTPAYVEADKRAAAGDVIAQFEPLLTKVFDFGQGAPDLSTYAVEKQASADAFLAALAVSPDPTDDFQNKNAAAWAKLADVMRANLSGLELYKVGPKAADGTLATDKGSYEYILVGKHGAKTAGVAFESVET